MSQTYQIKQNDIVVDLPKIVGVGYGQFWRSRSLYRVVKGSRGSKKSKTTALNYVIRLLKYPWANLLVIRRYSNTNKQSTYTDFKWAANQLKVAHKFKFNESLPEITVKETGQKILFRGLDDELKITSITVDVGSLCWAWFEEAYQIETEDKFSTVVESIRGSLNVPDFFKQITVTFNPWNERHWLKRVFFDEETRRARIVCDGEWGVAEGLIYENVTVKEFNKDELLQDSANKLCIGLDFGFTHDPTALCCSLINDTTKEIYVFDEAYKVGLITKEVAKMIKDKGYHRSQIIADSAELRLIEELRSEHGITRIKESRKGKDSIMAGVSKLQGYAIYVHPDCKNIMDEFYSYCYQQDKEGNWLNKPEDKNNHLMDALRYSLQCIEGGKATVRRRSDYGL